MDQKGFGDHAKIYHGNMGKGMKRRGFLVEEPAL